MEEGWNDIWRDAWNKKAAERFGDTLAVARRSIRLSQEELAELSEISRTTIARLEGARPGANGKLVRPTPETIIALVKGLALGNKKEMGARLYARGIYKQLMKAAGYHLLLAHPDEVMNYALLDDQGREHAMHDFLNLSSQVNEQIERLNEMIESGLLNERDLRLIRNMVEFLINQLESESD
jgi:transcriptional regulator with XRE-family HTH domain